jgi:hypothetical protein
MSGGDAGWAWRSCAFRVAMPGAAGFGKMLVFPVFLPISDRT